MPQLLTTNARITCPHLGIGVTAPLTPWWSVSGGMVTCDGDSGVLSCIAPTPCGGYTLQSMKLNATTINGRQAMLVTDFNQTWTGLPLKIVETHAVEDNSTAAALPPGATSGTIAPALLDMTIPVVTAAPPAGAFSTITSLPPTLAVVFTLTAAFPKQWQLARISSINTHEILTGGNPAGATVGPSGGGWNQPSLTVTLTMTAAYMTAIGVGKHEFYMTAVNQRGRWSHAVFTLTIT